MPKRMGMRNASGEGRVVRECFEYDFSPVFHDLDVLMTDELYVYWWPLLCFLFACLPSVRTSL